MKRVCVCGKKYGCVTATRKNLCQYCIGRTYPDCCPETTTGNRKDRGCFDQKEKRLIQLVVHKEVLNGTKIWTMSEMS